MQPKLESVACKFLRMVARDGIEPPTPAFSGLCSTGGKGSVVLTRNRKDAMRRDQSFRGCGGLVGPRRTRFQRGRPRVEPTRRGCEPEHRATDIPRPGPAEPLCDVDRPDPESRPHAERMTTALSE